MSRDVKGVGVRALWKKGSRILASRFLSLSSSVALYCLSPFEMRCSFILACPSAIIGYSTPDSVIGVSDLHGHGGEGERDA